MSKTIPCYLTDAKPKVDHTQSSLFRQSQEKIESFIATSGLSPRVDKKPHKSAYYFALGQISMKLAVEQTPPTAVLTSRVRHPSTLHDYQRFTWGVNENLVGFDEAPQVLAFLNELFLDSSKKLPYQIDAEDDEYQLIFFDPANKTHLSIELY